MATTVKAPTADTVIDVLVLPGAPVRAGHQLALIEAMKMEFPIEAPVSGLVTAVAVSNGDSVAEGDVLFEIGASP